MDIHWGEVMWGKKYVTLVWDIIVNSILFVTPFSLYGVKCETKVNKLV